MSNHHETALRRIFDYADRSGLLPKGASFEPEAGESWPAWRNLTPAIWDRLVADFAAQAAIVEDVLLVLERNVDPARAVAQGSAPVLKRLLDAGDALGQLAAVRDAYATSGTLAPPTGLRTDSFERTTRCFTVDSIQAQVRLDGRLRRERAWTPAWLVDVLALPGVTLRINSPDEQVATSKRLPMLADGPSDLPLEPLTA